jgi:hypothetical protein
VSAGHALEVLDDRPVQELVRKAGKRPGRGAVPIQRTRIDLEPLKASNCLENAVRKVSARVPSQERKDVDILRLVPGIITKLNLTVRQSSLSLRAERWA